jgi:hypothetical protein
LEPPVITVTRSVWCNNGVVTGVDTCPDRPLSKSLALNHNLVGEGVTERFVRVVTTHYPEHQGQVQVCEQQGDSFDSKFVRCH